MNLIEKAFTELFPEREFIYEPSLKYSKAFSSYNANVKYSKTKLSFRLSSEWKGVSKEIQIGIIQSLLLKVFKEKKKTTNIDLYNLFLKNVHIGVPKTRIDPVLEKSYDYVNEKYFNGMLEKPNLVWGGNNFSKLGSYEYGTDTITISKVLEKDQNLLNYVMYHEMLHKKLKFSHKGGRSLHHSKQFREKEKKWEDPYAEEKLKEFLKTQRRKRWFWF